MRSSKGYSPSREKDMAAGHGGDCCHCFHSHRPIIETQSPCPFLFQVSTFQRFHRIPKQHYQLGPRVKSSQTYGAISQPHQTRYSFNVQILSLFSSQSELTQKSHLFHKITFKFRNKLPSPQQFPGMALILTSPGPITQFPFPLCSPERIFSSASLPVMECSLPGKVIRDATSLPEFHIFARIYPWEDWKFYTLGSY